jgi:hypothetical protein
LPPIDSSGARLRTRHHSQEVSMSRRARARTSFFGLAFLLIGIPLWWVRMPHPPTVALAAITLPPPPADFPCTLIRAGLDPKALAAGGASSQSISLVLAAAATQINSAPTTLSTADDSYAAARTQVDHLTSQIQSGHGSQEDISSLATATANLATATAQRQAALDAIFNAGTANLTQGQKAALSKIRSNRSWDLPLEFLVVDRTQSQWVGVRDALANERIAVDLPGTLNEVAQSSLATWRADPAVASAKSSSDANLASVTTAWNSGAGQ